MSVILIDGNGLAHKAFHQTKANPSFRSDGLPTAMIPTMLDKIWWIMGNVAKPQGCRYGALILDHPSRNWRHDIFPAYKANRPPGDPDLKCQLRIVREIASAFGIPVIDQRGYEADDLIATYVRVAEEAGIGSVIASADKDFLQLLRPGVTIYDTMSYADRGDKQILDETDAFKYFGVRPDRICDVQALAGDTVDNIPGLPGIGVKTAAELITRYGDMETLLANADIVPQPKRRHALMEGAETARLCRKLVELDDGVPVPVPLGELLIERIDAARIVASLKALEVEKFTAYFAGVFRIDMATVEPDPAILEFAAEIMEWRES